MSRSRWERQWDADGPYEGNYSSARYGYLTGVLIACTTVGLAIYVGMLIERYNLIGVLF
jgi:hypothetical protein